MKFDSEKVWQSLKEKKIAIVGNNTPWKDNFQESLSYMARREGIELSIREYLPVNNAEQVDGIIAFPNTATAQDLQEYLNVLRECVQQPPKTFLLMSDQKLYGKIYGAAKAIKEEELGYAGHITADQQPLFYQRMAEHMTCRMAKEGKLSALAARGCSSLAADELQEQITAVGMLLAKGKAGEIYNLPGTKEVETKTSPLSAAELFLDTTKFEEEMKESCD